jgi:adhesin transport system membrane fusion protein
MKLRDLLGGTEADVDEHEVSARNSANLVLLVIFLFFAAFFLWATLTKIDRTVRGVGRVIPSSKLQVVSNLEGGVIEEILVKAGEPVKKGDVLVRLSPTQSSAAYGSTNAEVSALQAKLARLNAEVRGTSPQYGSAPQSQVAIEESLRAARIAELREILSAGAARVRQAERSVVEAQSMLDAKRSTLAASSRELEMIRPMAEKMIISKVDLLKAENAADVARNEVDAAEAALARARSAVAEARAEMAQQRSDWMTRSGSELSQAQADLAAKEKELPALSDRVDRTVIRAPMSGKVNRVLVTTVGGTVSAGMPIAEIVPSHDALYVEAMVKPSDIANIRLGQKAAVEITAYNSAIYGKLDGAVTSISPDAVLNEKTGESFYTVEVETTDHLRDQAGKILTIGPGMVANVNLLGDKRSILSYIFTPITRLSENAFRE